MILPASTPRAFNERATIMLREALQAHLVYSSPASLRAPHGLYALIGHQPKPGMAAKPPMIRPWPSHLTEEDHELSQHATIMLQADCMLPIVTSEGAGGVEAQVHTSCAAICNTEVVGLD